MKILIIDDEVKLAKIIKEYLELERFRVDLAFDGKEGLEKISVRDYDLIILDLMLPEIDGFKVCRRLRSNKNQVPIIILTARETIDDRVRGLNLGADDYLIKPFDLEELVARIHALLRRKKEILPPLLKIGSLELNPAAHEIKKDNKVIHLTATEYDLLEYLMRHSNRVVTRKEILNQIRNSDFTASSNIIDVYIRYLRRKIDDKQNKIIKTIRGVGYKVNV